MTAETSSKQQRDDIDVRLQKSARQSEPVAEFDVRVGALVVQHAFYIRAAALFRSLDQHLLRAARG